MRLQFLERTVALFYFFWDAHEREPASHGDVFQRGRHDAARGGAWNGVAVRACRRVAQQSVETDFDLVTDDVLPLARFVVGSRPREPDDVGEESFRQPVSSDDAGGEFFAGRGELKIGGIHANKAG